MLRTQCTGSRAKTGFPTYWRAVPTYSLYRVSIFDQATKRTGIRLPPGCTPAAIGRFIGPAAEPLSAEQFVAQHLQVGIPVAERENAGHRTPPSFSVLPARYTCRPARASTLNSSVCRLLLMAGDRWVFQIGTLAIRPMTIGSWETNADALRPWILFGCLPGEECDPMFTAA
jgi:hypothetical protein